MVPLKTVATWFCDKSHTARVHLWKLTLDYLVPVNCLQTTIQTNFKTKLSIFLFSNLTNCITSPRVTTNSIVPLRRHADCDVHGWSSCIPNFEIKPTQKINAQCL